MLNVLVVDDSRVVRKLILNILSSRDFHCIEAENGIEALEKLVVNEVDIIIADLNMPKMSGLELVKTIRASDIYTKIPIIMLTTEKNEEEQEKCLNAGVNIYLIKPLPYDELKDNINRLLNKKEAAQS